MIIEKKVISMQEKLKDVVFDEIGELFNYANEYYGEYLLDLIDDFTEKKHQDDDLSSMMVPHIISWAILCHRVNNGSKTIFQHYLDSPEYKSRRRPKVHRIISDWKYTMPGFYYVEEIVGESIVRHTDAGAENGLSLAADVPCDAGPRAEVVPVGLIEIFHKRKPDDGIVDAEAVFILADHAVVIPAHPQVHRETLRQSDAVLEITGERILGDRKSVV